MGSQVLPGGSITMGAALSKETSGIKVAQNKGQQVLDSSHHTTRQLDLEMLHPKAQAEKDFMPSKYPK